MPSEAPRDPARDACEAYEARFSAAWDGALDAVERTDFEEHLAACDACRDAQDRFLASLHALRGYVARPLPTTFYERVRHLTTDEERTVWNHPRLAWAIAAAAVLLLGLALVLRDGLAPGRLASDDVAERPAELVVRAPVLTASTALVVHRGAEVLHVAAGATYVPQPDDRVSAPSPPPEVIEIVRTLPAPRAVEIAIDTAPLVQWLERQRVGLAEVNLPRPGPLWAADDTRRVQEWIDGRLAALERRWREIAATARAERSREPSPTDPRPPALGAEAPFGTPTADAPILAVRVDADTRLQVRGALHDVIPELIVWLDCGDVSLQALARARLRSIEQELAVVHGIPGPERRPPSRPQRTELETIVRSLDRTDSRPLLEPERADLDWRAWWNRHKTHIRDLDAPRDRRDRASI